MLFLTPKFWNDKNIISNILLPFSLIYKTITDLKNKYTKSYRSSIKVICVGNITVGGAGKTPTAIAIAKILKGKGKKIAFLSRGYNGSFKKILKISDGFGDAKFVGDEAILLSKIAPVYVAKNKVEALMRAERDLVDCIIMDDGMQNYSVVKDLSITVIDAGYGLGNQRIIPAGPLRENVDQLNQAQLIILIGDDKYNFQKKFEKFNVVTGRYKPIDLTIDYSKKYIGFSAIARPEKFFDTLRMHKVNLVDTYKYPDHHYYKEREIENLIRIADERKCCLITTEKDIVKINKRYHKKISVLKIRLVIDDQSLINKIIDEKI